MRTLFLAKKYAILKYFNKEKIEAENKVSEENAVSDVLFFIIGNFDCSEIKPEYINLEYDELVDEISRMIKQNLELLEDFSKAPEDELNLSERYALKEFFYTDKSIDSIVVDIDRGCVKKKYENVNNFNLVTRILKEITINRKMLKEYSVIL